MTDAKNDQDLKKLESEYKQGIKSRNKDLRISSLLNLGSLYIETKKYSQAETHLLKAFEMFGKNENSSILSVANRSMGTVSLKLFKLDEAEKYYLEALKLTPEKNKRIISLIYNGLGDVYTKLTKVDLGLEYYFKALKLRKELKFWKGVSETLNKIGVNYFYQSAYDKAEDCINQSLELRRDRHENDETIAACLNNLSLVSYHKGDYSKAVEYGIKSLSIYERKNISDRIGMSYNNLGLIYFEMSLFSEALECQFKALKYKEKTSDKPFLANTLANIGMIFSRLYNLDKALDYSKKALELRKSAGDKRGIAGSYNDIGRIYDKLNQFDQAVKYFEESIAMRRDMKFLSGLSVTLENLGMVYLKQGRIPDARKCLFEAKEIAESLGEQKAISGIYRNIASLSIQDKKYEEALVYIKRSAEIAESLNLKDKQRDANKILSEIYGRKNDFKKALAYYIKYSKLNEEILSITKQHELNTILHKYENYKSERETELFRLKNIELTKINKELKRSKSELVRSNSSKDKFFNIIAHDLKNPFSILYTTSELLTTYFDELSTKKQKEYVKTINTSTQHLLKLIENLLEWSRTQSGLKQFNPVKFIFSESICSCIELIRPNAEAKNIFLDVDIGKDTVVTADKNMLKTVIRNFLTNAVKFTRPGGRIKISAGTEAGRLFFKVEDNGVGIKKKDMPKLFAIDKHFATNGTANEKGTGIGLILCREFIDKHKGKIIVESNYRKGSVFGFEIPLG